MDGAYFNKVIHKAAATMIFSVLLFSAAKHYCQAVGRSGENKYIPGGTVYIAYI